MSDFAKEPAPDATGKCGELVTVEHQYWTPESVWKRQSEAFVQGVAKLGGFTRELVTRSQAEELLAAEQTKKEMLAESLHIQIKRVNELEADNATLTARVKELEAEWQKGHDFAHEAGLQWKEKADSLEVKLAAAEKALKTARPYVEDYDTRRHNTGVDETLTQIDAALGGKP
ncbi:hypothetical protein [Brucella intermedia]|uniref:hypothetical protein n=1 Tax=Brucella intermedia TaxID=94625 RepID=UPI00224AB620|nr:hypothetical protein [Brucella intermedia]